MGLTMGLTSANIFFVSPKKLFGLKVAPRNAYQNIT